VRLRRNSLGQFLKRRRNPAPKGAAKTRALMRSLERRGAVDIRRPSGSRNRDWAKQMQLARAIGRRRRTGNPGIKRRIARNLLRGVALRAARRRRNPLGAALAGLNSVNPRRNPKRKAHTMARRRRSAAQRAAFRKMIAGLKRHRGGKSRRRRNPRKRGGSHMARRRTHRSRRRAAVIMVNPRRRRRAHARRRNPSHRRRRFSRRRNPGMSSGGIKGAVRSVFMAAIPAVGAGFVANFIDAKFLSAQNIVVRVLAKVAQAAAAAMLFRGKPVMAYSAMGGVLGSIGGDFGTQFAGGAVVGATPVAKAAGVAALITEDPRTMGVLVEGMRGMGYQIDSNVSLGDAASLPVGSYQDVNLG
jgi:hypothetical protein